MRESFNYPLSIFREVILSVFGWIGAVALTAVFGVWIVDCVGERGFAPPGTAIMIFLESWAVWWASLPLAMGCFTTVLVFAVGMHTDSFGARLGWLLVNLVVWPIVVGYA